MSEEELRARLHALIEEHRDLSATIDALSRPPAVDALRLQRLKRQKLRVKDEIAALTDLLIPDIIA
ncbi:MAG: DUF465 domain-containing protein [Sphingomonadaceae bacterium]